MREILQNQWNMFSQVTLPPCSDELPNELTEGNIAGLQPISAQGSVDRSAGEQSDAARPAGGRHMSAEASAEVAEETYNELSDWTP